MTETRCDRCNAAITKEKGELTLVLDNRVESLIEDVCPRCISALRDWCRPLPTVADRA